MPCKTNPPCFNYYEAGAFYLLLKSNKWILLLPKHWKCEWNNKKKLSWFLRKTSNRPPSNQVQCRFQVVTRSSNSPFLPLVSPWKGDTLLYTSCKTLAEGHIRKTHKKGDIYFFWKMRDMNWKFCTNLIEPLPRNTSWQLCTNPGKSPGRANDFVGFRFQRKVGGGR